MWKTTYEDVGMMQMYILSMSFAIQSLQLAGLDIQCTE